MSSEREKFLHEYTFQSTAQQIEVPFENNQATAGLFYMKTEGDEPQLIDQIMSPNVLDQ